jgi:hypothetical protein
LELDVCSFVSPLPSVLAAAVVVVAGVGVDVADVVVGATDDVDGVVASAFGAAFVVSFLAAFAGDASAFLAAVVAPLPLPLVVGVVSFLASFFFGGIVVDVVWEDIKLPVIGLRGYV